MLSCLLCWTQIWPEEEGTWQLFASSPEAMAEADAVIENLLKVSMDAGLFFVFSSPEVMAEADAVIENLLKVWSIHACSSFSQG